MYLLNREIESTFFDHGQSEDSFSTTDEQKRYSKINWGWHLGLGYEYFFSSRMSLFIEPKIEWTSLRFRETSETRKEKFYVIALNTGVLF